MLHALQAPLFRSVLVATLVLGVGVAAYARQSSTPNRHRLSLHTNWDCDAIYLSSWTQGEDLKMSISEGELRPLVLENRAWMWDGCKWLGTETLVPIDNHRYSYEYEETVLSCKPGHHPTHKTPRTGIVVVDE
jgi:hypothetical protein